MYYRSTTLPYANTRTSRCTLCHQFYITITHIHPPCIIFTLENVLSFFAHLRHRICKANDSTLRKHSKKSFSCASENRKRILSYTMEIFLIILKFILKKIYQFSFYLIVDSKTFYFPVRRSMNFYQNKQPDVHSAKVIVCALFLARKSFCHYSADSR